MVLIIIHVYMNTNFLDSVPVNEKILKLRYH